MTVFVISVVRAVIEMLGLCLLGQGILFVVAGRSRGGNRIYQLFELLTKAPRKLLANVLPARTSPVTVGILSFLILLLAWIGLAFVRKSI